MDVGEDFAAKATVSSVGAHTASFLQSVHENAAVGNSFCYYYYYCFYYFVILDASSSSVLYAGVQIVVQRQAVVGGVVVGRFANDKFVSTLALSSFGSLSASYLQKISDR